MKWSSLFLGLTVLGLCHPAKAQIRDHAVMANPFSHVRTALSIGDETMWILDAVIPFYIHPPLVQKWNAQGELVLDQRLALPPGFMSGISDISVHDMALRDDRILIAGGGISSLFLFPALIQMQEDGTEIDSIWNSPWYLDYILNAAPLQDDAMVPVILHRKGYQMAGLYRLDDWATMPELVLEDETITTIGVDDGGRLLAAFQSGVLAEVNPWMGGIMDTLVVVPGHISLLEFPQPGQIFLAGDGFVALHDVAGAPLASYQVPDARFKSVMFKDQRVYLVDKEGVIFIFDDQLQLLSTIPFPHAGYAPEVLVAGKETNWILGTDTYGAFRIPFSEDGDIPPLETDVSLEGMQADVMQISPAGPPFNPFKYELEASGLRLQVRNMGSDTLRQLSAIWFICSFIFHDDPGLGYRGFHTQEWRDMAIAPGDSGILTLADTIYPLMTYLGEFPDPCLELCISLQAPNNRMDADRSNDRFCLPISLVTTTANPMPEPVLLTAAPNPGRGEVRIAGWENSAVRVIVSDARGVPVYERESGIWDGRLDTGGWPAGVYQVRVHMEQTGMTGMVMVVVSR